MRAVLNLSLGIVALGASFFTIWFANHHAAEQYSVVYAAVTLLLAVPNLVLMRRHMKERE